MASRNAGLGSRCVEGSGRPVSGDVAATESHLSIAGRSYVCPSTVLTGSFITSCVIGQKKWCGMEEAGITSERSVGSTATSAIERHTRLS